MTIKLIKKILCSVVSLAAVIALLAGCNSGEVYRLIKVKSFDGAVTVEREEKMNAFEGLQLISEDKVEVGDASLLELLADSDKHIVAEENTAFKLLSSGNEKSGNITVEMLYGKSLFTIDNKLPDGSTFEVYTPNATLSVRGTIFTVTYDPETNKTSVKVMEGVVAVTTAEETEELTAGKTATITTDIINRNGETEEIPEETSETTEETPTETTEEASEETEEVEKKPRKIDKSLTWTYYKEDGSIRNYSVFEYDSEGKKTGWHHYDGDGTLSSYDLYEYDSDGNMIKESSYNADGTLNNYRTYKYNSNGDNTELNFYNTDGTLNDSYTYEYKYNSNGHMVEEIGYDSDGTVYFWITREPTPNNADTRTNTYNSDGTLKSYSLYEYNSYGGFEKITQYQADGTISSYSTHECNADGEMTISNYYNSDGILTSYSTYEYDSDHQTTKKYDYSSEGILERIDTYEYWE